LEIPLASMKNKELKKEIETSMEKSINQLLLKLKISEPNRRTRKALKKYAKDLYDFLKQEYSKELKKLKQMEKVVRKKALKKIPVNP
jgi:hypothetical protein